MIGGLTGGKWVDAGEEIFESEYCDTLQDIYIYSLSNISSPASSIYPK